MAEGAGRITLWGIEVFVATAEERSISAAARRLGASPSAVSQQLTNLETELGATLLLRNARPVVLTAAGEAFRRRAETILNEAAQARAEVRGEGGAGLSRLRLGMIDDLEADITPRLLTRLAGQQPTCQFLLETNASHVLYDQLDAQALDLVVAAEMGPAPAWAEVHPLWSENFVIAVREGDLDPSGPVLDQLRNRPLVHYTTRHHMGRLVASHLTRLDLTLAHRFELDSYHALLAMVGQGEGWTILPPLALMRARRLLPGLAIHPLPFAPLTRRIVLTARAGMLGELPERVADEIRTLLQEVVLAPAEEAYPTLKGTVRVL
ncbi:LysR family transcriptional regulator [Oceanicola sp. 22II-s10i]|uniref:LysR family transcriptional regulator n=1 Tax=Oceanicola sp. 22II-s10i TaxID=1317116 RepID=UPI000B52490B|nr:LysR family transcriptional regulator [Oceanicola sp. 22II-s10i]OWU82345.1 LysR family transcriptional regulator [Oceanicola sp. 22II-s10i]